MAPGDGGIWLGSSGSLALIARYGNHAPGTPSGVTFQALDQAPFVLNESGQIAFFAFATDGVGANSQGIWATDRSGQLQLIARTGDLVEVSPGDFRTISTLGYSQLFDGITTNNNDGRPSGFNNLGQVAFRASFTDGSRGVFVSNRVAVPEPSTLLLLCFGSLAALWRRRPAARDLRP